VTFSVTSPLQIFVFIQLELQTKNRHYWIHNDPVTSHAHFSRCFGGAFPSQPEQSTIHQSHTIGQEVFFFNLLGNSFSFISVGPVNPIISDVINALVTLSRSD